MRLRRLLRIPPKYGVITLLVTVVAWNEYLDIKFRSLTWIKPSKTDKDFSILLIADPQLIGYRNEPYFIGWLSRWDADRYLRRGFADVFRTVQPKLVIFLGDLFDEGVQMTDLEFQWTLERFKKIFAESSFVPTIYLPGDNDIGGEMEPVYDRLVNKFQRYFPHSINSENTGNHFFDIGVINPMFSNKLEVLNKVDDSKVKILLSHTPLTRSINKEVDNAIADFDPDLILSAHDHTSEVYVKDRNSLQFQRFELHGKINFVISQNQPMVEIQCPTVSYRMGVPNMGYGVLTLSNESPATAEFTVFWLPKRYSELFAYVVCLVVLIYYCLRRYIAHILSSFTSVVVTKKFSV